MVYRVIISLLVSVIIWIGIELYITSISNNKLQEDNTNLLNAVGAYEAMIAVIPANVINKERSKNASEDINETLYDTSISTGDEWL